MGRLLVGLPRDAESLLLLVERRREFAVLKFQREHALLKVGNNRVKRVDEAFAVGDALFQLLAGGVVFMAHVRSVAQVARGGQCLAAARQAILGFLIRLGHLRRGIERAVPQARAFVWPGLDEPPVSFHTS